MYGLLICKNFHKTKSWNSDEGGDSDGVAVAGTLADDNLAVLVDMLADTDTE